MIHPSHGFALVTPASRGLGFAFAQQLLAKTPLPVVATVRRDKDGVHDKLLSGKNIPRSAEKRLSVLEVDVTGIPCPSSYPLTTPPQPWPCHTSISINRNNPSMVSLDRTYRRIHHLGNGLPPAPNVPENTTPPRTDPARYSSCREISIPDRRCELHAQFPGEYSGPHAAHETPCAILTNEIYSTIPYFTSI